MTSGVKIAVTIAQAATCAVAVASTAPPYKASLTLAMAAGVAVHVERGLGQVGAGLGAVAILMVLVHMVAEMRGAGSLLMAAIASRRGPDGLQRHEGQQEDEQEAAHEGEPFAVFRGGLTMKNGAVYFESPRL